MALDQTKHDMHLLYFYIWRNRGVVREKMRPFLRGTELRRSVGVAVAKDDCSQMFIVNFLESSKAVK